MTRLTNLLYGTVRLAHTCNRVCVSVVVCVCALPLLSCRCRLLLPLSGLTFSSCEKKYLLFASNPRYPLSCVTRTRAERDPSSTAGRARTIRLSTALWECTNASSLCALPRGVLPAKSIPSPLLEWESSRGWKDWDRRKDRELVSAILTQQRLQGQRRRGGWGRINIMKQREWEFGCVIASHHFSLLFSSLLFSLLL